MFQVQEVTMDAHYEGALFAPHHARLWTLESCANSPSIYLLNCSYDDKVSIVRNYDFKNKRYQAVFYRNKNSTLAVQLVAVRINKNAAIGSKLSATTVNYSYRNNVMNSHFGKWLPVNSEDKFLRYHQTHRYKYYFSQLKEVEPLRDLLLKLKIDERKGDLSAAIKAKALEYFFQVIEDGVMRTFWSLLTNADHPTYQAMVKPRPHIYSLLDFITIDFTARSPFNTTTYKLLKSIRESEMFQILKQEFIKEQENPPSIGL